MTTPVEAGAPEAAAEAGPPVDHGAPSSTYPAFPPDFGQLVQAGPGMSAPVIVAITWDSDASQASFDTFADTVGGTAYWKAASSEYGVGPATSGTVNHVHMSTAAPAKVQDSDLQAMVTAGVTATTNPWPKPTTNTIYAFFLPPSTSVQTQDPSNPQGGLVDACTAGIGGYHDQIANASLTAAYAVVPSCTFGGQNSAAQQTTMSMSHELLEAATDPAPGQGLTGFDNEHFAFDYFQVFQSENGDACEFFKESFFEDKETTPAAFDYWVQSTWSNKSGKAGHNPCAPVPANEAYFNVTPLAPEGVNVYLPPQLTGSSSATTQATHGFKVANGETKSFMVGFYSDAATSGPWTISVVAATNPILQSQDPLSTQYNPAKITASLDKTSGQNGEKAQVTVNVSSTGTLLKGELVTIVSSLNGVKHYMPLWISSQ